MTGVYQTVSRNEYRTNKAISKFSLACTGYGAICGHPPLPQRLLEERKYWAQWHDTLKSYQKLCNTDRELAKYFSVEAKEALKMLRACRLLIPHYCDDPLPGDCKYVDTWEWPEELFSALDYICNVCSYTKEELCCDKAGIRQS
jgi:hypothetical protein